MRLLPQKHVHSSCDCEGARGYRALTLTEEPVKAPASKRVNKTGKVEQQQHEVLQQPRSDQMCSDEGNSESKC
jgi:hypothetical protein